MLYICIPARDKAETVGILLWKIRQVMADFPREYQLLVLDDGSTDGTDEVLEPYLRVLPLTVIRHDVPRGYAASLERLIREAVGRATHPRRDIVITLQADFSDAPDEIPALVKRIEGGADLVQAIDAGAGDDLPRMQRWTRGIVGWMLRRGGLPEGVDEPLSGYRAYRIWSLKKALGRSNGDPLLSRDGWAADVELLLSVAPYLRRSAETEIEKHYRRPVSDNGLYPWRAVGEAWAVVRQAQKLAEVEAGSSTSNETTNENSQ